MPQQTSYEALLALLEKYRDRLRSQLLIDVFNNKNLRGASESEVAEYYGYSFVSNRFTFLVLNFVDRLTGSSMRKRQAMDRAGHLLEKALLPSIPEGAVCVTDDLLLCLLNLESDDLLSRYAPLLSSSFSLLLSDEVLKNFYCIMGVGIPCSGISSLRASFDSAVSAIQYGVLSGYDRWYISTTSDSSHLKSVPFSARQISSLQSALASRSEPLLEEWVRGVFSDASPLFQEDPTYAYLLPRNIAQKAYALAEGSPGAELLAHAGDLLEACVSLEQEEQVLITLFRQFCAADRREVNPAVILVQNYLQYHFHEHINLNALGALTELNPQYLSVMFKRETGVSITDWLRRLRLGTAQELLRSTGMTVAQIAQTVGYDDPLYFSRVFQREFRQSPRSYRTGTGGSA